MAVLIKGMEIPKSCFFCYLHQGVSLDIKGRRGYFICAVTKKQPPLNKRPDWCPIIEVHTKTETPLSDEELEECHFEL